MLDNLPQSVRYVKNGSGSRWWEAARARSQLHCGWWFIPRELLHKADLARIKDCIQHHAAYKNPGTATADFNALRSVFEKPSQHIWVTFEDSCLWWCTVRDGITVNVDRDKEKTEGSFWLTCDRPWSNRTVGGRLLARSDLPGKVAAVAGFRATICEPKGSPDILRIIQDREDQDSVAATQAREAYTAAVAKLVTKLHDRDFELLIDLILARTGWVRVEKLGGVIEGTDIKAENVATNEFAFVQIKSEAGQHILDDYVKRFQSRREVYDRMIFAVHSPIGTLSSPEDKLVDVWKGDRIAELAVRLGLGEWIAKRL
jgi:hypothetical protein